MGKQRPKTKEICRISHPAEPEIDKEHQKLVNDLATQFKEDQLKIVLRRCYDNVQKYGPEAILKAVEDSWTSMAATACHGIVDDKAFVKMEQEIAEENLEEALEADPCRYGTTHSHEETAKQNALFLIESSERIDYDAETITKMKQACERGHYDDVADLAYLHDRCRRPVPSPKESCEDEAPPCRESKSPWQRVSVLLEEVVDESQKDSSPLKCCVEAVRYLSRDLTYDNRSAAKDAVRKAIDSLEE